MASKLNKKYFGNRNIGTTGSSDDKIGGEGIASINWSNLGLFRGNSTNEPLIGLDLPAPSIPTGVQATWTVTFEVASVSTGAGKADLVVGDTYTYAAGGSPTITVDTISGTNATFTTTAGSGIAYGSLPRDTTGILITKVTGSGPATFLTDINFKVKSATINEKGSGYTGAETFTVTTDPATTGAAPVGTIVLTTDTGNVGSSTNQENAILAYAYIGGSRKLVDIIGQKGARRYKVTDGTNTAVCSLVTGGAASAAGEMDITVLDSDSGAYWVKKLNNRRCTVVSKASGGGTQFATDSSVPWVLGAAVEDVSVSIANA
jgi:hypothetical protein